MSVTNISFQMPHGFEPMQPVVDKLLRNVMAEIDTKADDAQFSASGAQITADGVQLSLDELAASSAATLKEILFLGGAV